MSRTLALIAAAGLALCAAFFTAAWMIGGDAIFHDSNSFRGIKPLIDLATHKEWRWDGGDSLALDAPVNIRYQASGPPRITVTGNAELLKHVRVGGGRIAIDSPARRAGSAKPRLDAVISGMALRKFVVNGHESLQLGVLDQDELDIYVNGGGSVSGSGRVKKLNLVIAGSGSADLAGLAVQDAKVVIPGSGKATVAVHGELQLVVTGSGRLFLAAKPQKIQQAIMGSGGISNADSGEMPILSAPPIPPVPPLPPVPQADGASQYTLLHHENVDLGHIDQQSLSITIPGSGKIRAEGRVENLSVQVFGSGKVDLGKLAAGSVSVRIMGSGDVIIAPSGNLQVAITGSGTVHLRTRPSSISRSILGSGRIIEEY
jgi:hypothetical protein